MIRKRIPIRRRFMRTVLLTTIISILAVSVTGFLCIRWIRGANEKTLVEELEVSHKDNIGEYVNSLNARLEHYEKYLEFMTDTLDKMYANKEEMIDSGKMLYPPSDTHEYEFTRAFAKQDINKKDLDDEIRFFSNLEPIWGPIARENEGLINTMYLGTKDGLLISYDKYSYLSFRHDKKDVIYNYYVSDWYKKGMSADDAFYTGVYMDSQGRGLTITIGSGFKDEKGETAGVICMDFDLASFYEDMLAMDSDEDTFIFALDHEEKIISPDSDTLDLEEYTGLTLDEFEELMADPNGIMEKGDAVYLCIPVEKVEWTLFARVPKDAIQSSIHDADMLIWKAMLVFMAVVLLILAIAVFIVNKSVRSITYPLELLGRDIKQISDGDLSYRASVYRNDEIGDITSGMNEMVDRLNFTLNELISSQQHADEMSRLATRDSLTGIRNKTAFDAQSKILAEELAGGDTEFGFAVVDLNNLKLINDNYGHEKGDAAIVNLSNIICDVFAHSPVYRIGGDEFVVLLKDTDYQNIESLVGHFKGKTAKTSVDNKADPWERTSAAIGYALYDKNLDEDIESVFSRADHNMYNCKKAMKSRR